MLDEAAALPDDPDDLRALAERLIAEVKAQAVLIEKLRHQLAGHRAHRFGASAETAEQLQLALETTGKAPRRLQRLDAGRRLCGLRGAPRGGDIREGSQRSRRDRSVRGTDRRRGRLAHVRRKFVDVHRS